MWRKNALIVVIYGLNFSFKMQFLIVSNNFSVRRLLFRVVHDSLPKCPNSKKTPLAYKIHGYAPGMVVSTSFICVSKYLSIYGAEAALKQYKN